MARARLSELKAEVLEFRNSGPPCIGCRFRTWTGLCAHDALARHDYSYSTGKYAIEPKIELDVARSKDGICGPEGVLWEPLPWYRAPFAETFAIADRHPWLMLCGLFGVWGVVDLLF